MTITEPGPAEGFTVRVYKRLHSNPALFWGNTYELYVKEATDQELLLAASATIVAFEAMIHLTDVDFDRVVTSTLAVDGEPYDPESFVSESLSVNGEVSAAGSDPLSLNHCLFVRRNTTSGRAGKLFYRRCLTEIEMESPSGTPALVSGSAVPGRVADAITDSGLSAYLGAASNIYIAMLAPGQVVRSVSSLNAAGIRIVQYNNRYFDVP